MKKIILSIFLIVIVLSIIICFKLKQPDNSQNLTKVKVAEVTHSIFYAPQYIAIKEGFFEEEGLDIELSLASGADAVTSAVLSGDVDIGLCGTEATIYVYNAKEKDYLMTFAGLTKRDGSFLVSRVPYQNFTLDDLKGKYVIGGRKGGMPEMTFEWALREHGINPNTDLTIDTSIAFSAMEGAFIGGTGDFVTLFEPNASNIEKEGLGYIVAYIGELGKEVPYTSYSARKSYIQNNTKTIKAFSNAIDKALKYVENTDLTILAKDLEEFFPDTSLKELEKTIDKYRQSDAWRKNITITEKEFEHIEEIVIAAGELEKTVPYQDLIYTNFFQDYE